MKSKCNILENKGELFSLLLQIKKCEEIGISYEYILHTQKNILTELIKVVEKEFTLESIKAVEEQQKLISELEFIPLSIPAYEIYKTGEHCGHKFVDLGLPSGTLWAECNVGAEKPEDFGDYFAWGEIKPKEKYNWGTYKWMKEGMASYKGVNKYVNYNNDIDYRKEVWDEKEKIYIVNLNLDDDAAHMNWGGKWHMPSKIDFDELLTECTWNRFTLNGVEGFMVTSNINNKRIFFPKADSRNYKKEDKDKEIYYWSSSSSLFDFAFHLCEGFKGRAETCECNRDYGCSVRPVLTLI